MGAYRVPEHIWRTRDDRLVLAGDPDAAFLAYPTGDEMSEEQAKRLGIVDVVAGRQAGEKAAKRAPAAEKVSPGQRDKAGGEKHAT